MKRTFAIVIILCCAAFSLLAQSQSLQLIYITKDHTTQTSPLSNEIMDIFHSAEKDRSQAVIFYLANQAHPIIVKVNLPSDNRKDMPKLMDALISKSETVIDPTSDILNFIEIFNENEIINANGNRKFTNVEIIYYITPTFWNLQYNEQLIAASYFTLGMDREWASGYFSMSIYHNANDGLIVDDERPFGPKNLCRNYNFFLLTYSN